MEPTYLEGGLDETWSEPSGRAARPEAASSVAPVVIHYRGSLRPCLGTAIAPRRRARFRQTLLAGALDAAEAVELVLPGAVAAGPAVEPVREPVPGEDHVVARAAVDGVAALVALELVVAEAPVQVVVAAAPVDEVLAGTALEDVVAALAV